MNTQQSYAGRANHATPNPPTAQSGGPTSPITDSRQQSTVPALSDELVTIPEDLYNAFIQFKSISDDFLGISESPVYAITRILESWLVDARLYKDSTDMKCLLTTLRLLDFLYDLRVERESLEWFQDEARKMAKGGQNNE
ncbi:hypothetical protein [Spirosoma agri]|uniref:Uncharacterized protein n=1 Tax=Spirosoma agri TaxID=1987381 RepID=A0A6M0IJB5_9BACT|nr:hypothetical protein [Spirosoma agri]NEU68304.1 hypothetical protein [Spirosoma agri]